MKFYIVKNNQEQIYKTETYKDAEFFVGDSLDFDIISVNVKVTDKFRKYADLYKIFANEVSSHYDLNLLDYSETALTYQFKSESMGGIWKFNYTDKINGKFNAYAIGKHWMDVQITSWLDDIEIKTGYNTVRKDITTKHEIISDTKYPVWFLSKLFDVSELQINDIRNNTIPFPNGFGIKCIIDKSTTWKISYF